MFDGKAFGVEIVSAVKQHIEKAVSPLLAQIDAMRLEIDALKAMPAPKDGKDADPDAITAIVEAKFAEDIASMKAEIEGFKPNVDAFREIVAEEMGAIISAIPEPVSADAIKAMVDECVHEAVAAIPPAQPGKDADLVEVAAIVAAEVERAVAALPAPKDGQSVTIEDLRPLIDEAVTKAVTLIPIPKDGQDGADVVDLLIDREGALVATLSNGRTKTLGPVIGKDGEAGKDADIEAIKSQIAAAAPEIDQAMIARMIAEAVAKHEPEGSIGFAPDEVAVNVALAVKMMAETPMTQATRQEAQPINVYSSVTMPEMKAAETVVNVTVPEQAAPVVNMGVPIVNVAPANVEFPKRGKEITTVTGWDKSGRITSFEKTEE